MTDDHSNEKRLIARGLGKWSEAGVPKRGWELLDVADLGGINATCEMCEVMAIRFVHHMQHPDYPDELGVGCVCAEAMLAPYAKGSARRAEKKLRNRAIRRARFPGLNGWQVDEDGKHRLRKNGYRITVFYQGGGWKGRLWHAERVPEGEFGTLRHPTPRAAKLAIFDRLEQLEEEPPPPPARAPRRFRV